MTSSASAAVFPHVERFWGSQRIELLTGRHISADAIQVRQRHDGASVTLKPGYDVSVRTKNGVRSLVELQREGLIENGQLQLRASEIADISDGLTRWQVSLAPGSTLAQVSLEERLDVRLLKSVAMVLLFSLAVIAVLSMPQWADDGQLKYGPPVVLRAISAAVPPKPATPKLAEKITAVSTSSNRAPVSPRPGGAPQQKKTAQQTLLQLMGGAPSFGGSGLSASVTNALNALGPGSGVATSGNGLEGIGPRGNGGPGIGPAGIGGIGQLGVVRGPPGNHGIEFNHAKRLTVVPVGPPKIEGGLDHDVVRKVIERHQGEIKFCYESELHKDASLAGKVAVQFTIDGSGIVSTAAVAETSMNGDAVQSCILGRIQRWKFPEPKGGGVVSVTYPWLFKAAGEE